MNRWIPFRLALLILFGLGWRVRGLGRSRAGRKRRRLERAHFPRDPLIGESVLMARIPLLLALLAACSGEKTDKTDRGAAPAASGSPTSGAPAGGAAAAGGACRAYSSCELTPQADFTATIGSTIAPHEKPQGNSKQIYHCAVDAHGGEPFADVSINCRSDGRTHEQYMLAYDGAKSIKGFQEVTGMGRSGFVLATATGAATLEVEADDNHVVLVSVFAVAGGKEIDAAKALAGKILDRLR